MTNIEHAVPGMSDDGQYIVYPIFPSNPVKGVASILLMWVTAAGGAEVTGTTNLSGRTARLTAHGH